jgi:hypothetical protein
MADSIFLSDEYGWTASFGLFEWVLKFLLEHVSDPATRQELQTVHDLHLGAVDVRELPDAGRVEIMRALREDLAAAAESSTEFVQPELARRFTVGHLKVLKLMADDLARG